MVENETGIVVLVPLAPEFGDFAVVDQGVLMPGSQLVQAPKIPEVVVEQPPAPVLTPVAEVPTVPAPAETPAVYVPKQDRN